MQKKEELLMLPVKDRRLLVNIPDSSQRRSGIDRRYPSYLLKNKHPYNSKLYGKRYFYRTRYNSQFSVQLYHYHEKEKSRFTCISENISVTGILLRSKEPIATLRSNDEVTLKFKIPKGTIPESYETNFNVKAKVIRTYSKTINDEEYYYYGLQFSQSLEHYLKQRRWLILILYALILLLFTSFVVTMMRAESIVYFKSNPFLYFYSLIAATFLLSRYIFGILYRNVDINPEYEPGVSIIIPVFNEEQWIHRTILSCIDQDYPLDKLEVIVVDDHSTDRTVEEIKKIVDLIHLEGDQFKTKERLKYIVLPVNKGKREALITGVIKAKFDLVVFVDSDSFLAPDAIRHLVQPFQDPKMGGVAGRTEVENKYTNTLTKFQTVRYYIAFRIMKAAEAYFDCVTCLSGPLSCYRKDLVLAHSDAWLNQTFLRHPATFGDDRSMTNYILETHRTSYQDLAICSTIVPSKMKIFLKQQMRWKRSWLRESLRAASFIWKKESFMAFFFYVGVIVPIAAPMVVLYNLVFVPIFHHIFPKTFLLGILFMTMLLSFTYLFFRKSSLWFYGFVFVFYYQAILLWQMPIAWVTFWKSEWGTRDTPQDLKARNRNFLKKLLFLRAKK